MIIPPPPQLWPLHYALSCVSSKFHIKITLFTLNDYPSPSSIVGILLLAPPARNRPGIGQNSPCMLLPCLTRLHFLPRFPRTPSGPSISLIRFCSYSLSIR